MSLWIKLYVHAGTGLDPVKGNCSATASYTIECVQLCGNRIEEEPHMGVMFSGLHILNSLKLLEMSSRLQVP